MTCYRAASTRYWTSEKYRASRVRYFATAEGHAARARYNASIKGRAVLARYSTSDKSRARRARYLASDKGRVAQARAITRYFTPTRRSWHAMRGRCTQPGHVSYPYYGGRGITVCERWRSFKNFLQDMGERPPGTTIDRIDVNGNYEPRNCRWATPREQQFNQRRHEA